MRVKFDKDPLAVEQNNYLTKIINFYIAYDLAAWPRNPTKIFKFNNRLFGATSIVMVMFHPLIINESRLHNL